MTQHRVEVTDKRGIQLWIDCAAQLSDELRALNNEKVNSILDKYEFRRCDYGMGLNIDWPDKK